MMESIVEEKLVSFKTLEKKVFAYVCELGRMITKVLLESYDDELAGERDRKTGRPPISICWMRRCRWKKSG